MTSCINLLFGDSLNNICTANCPTNYFGDILTYLCSPCNPICVNCTDNTILHCSACQPPYFIFSNGTCLSNCPDGYFNNNITN